MVIRWILSPTDTPRLELDDPTGVSEARGALYAGSGESQGLKMALAVLDRHALSSLRASTSKMIPSTV